MATVQQAGIEQVAIESLAYPDVLLRQVNETFVKELSQSITNFGLRDPIHARQLGAGTRRIIDGVHRLEAVKLLGWKSVACRVERTIDDFREIEMQLTFKIQKDEFVNPWAEGKLLAKLKFDKYGTVDSMSRALGKSRGYIQSRLRIFFSLNPSLVPLIGGPISISNAMALSHLTSAKQLEFAERVTKKRTPRGPAQETRLTCTCERCGDIHIRKSSQS